MPNKYTATHEGFTFKRTSQNRTYTHAVLVRCSLRADIEREIQRARKTYAQDLDFYRDIATGAREASSHYEGDPAASRESAQAWIDAGPDGLAAKYVDHLTRSRAGRQLAADGDTYYAYIGWCGRLDLAEKLARTRPGSIIVEAQRS